MAIFKCKMCGGTLEINSGETVATCEYCGTKQTLPKLDDEKRANMYDRANHFRRNNEFDKAMGIYEQILNEDNTDAESYWSLVLCRYGIEYVEDPSSHKRVPTVNRAQFTSIFDDDNYKSALQYADGYQKNIYEQEAAAINEIQKGILEISNNEEPFDVFICYKESDNNGRRTPDSVLANDLYHQLTQEGFKVFFARITLEDKLGSAYEPYIFAALNSAKAMVVLGTKPEYFNAIWVKNEWSRYLALIKQGQKKMLIPAYKDMDPYDLPEEFSHLQAQDMSKLGFMQDLVRGIKKILHTDEPKTTVVKETVVTSSNVNTDSLLKRAFMFLEDGDWENANEYCEKVLDIAPECATAYLGKLMAELQVRKQENLKNCPKPFDNKNNYSKVMRFGDENLRSELSGFLNYINERNENERIEGIYSKAKNIMDTAKSQERFEEAIEVFENIKGYKDVNNLIPVCKEKAENARKDAVLSEAEYFICNFKSESVNFYKKAISLLEKIPGWRNADELIDKCNVKIEEIWAKHETERLERERKEAEAKAEAERIAKRTKLKKLLSKIAVAGVIVVVGVIIAIVIRNNEIAKHNNALVKYDEALVLLEAGEYEEAIPALYEAKNINDAKELLKNAVVLSNEKWKNNISANSLHIVGLKSDGTVIAVGGDGNGQGDVENWTDIVGVFTADRHTLGLKADGTVVATGNNNYGQCNVGNWRNIVAISTEHDHTVGLRSDGTVVATGDNEYGQCNVGNWRDIVAIFTDSRLTLGIKSDGTVVAVGDNRSGRCDVGSWTDIVAISAGFDHTVGLKADGTVVAVGSDFCGKCDVGGWTDIVEISASSQLTIGLKADGTIVTAGNEYKCNFEKWTDVVAISSSGHMGLKADGTVVTTSGNVKKWKNIVAIFDKVGLKSDGTVVTDSNEKYLRKYSFEDWDLF